ncbi:MAG: hypothetical protein IT163_09795 [Bryobacterales bacterium]|nr:hypothetical protein [Bryobacterales bacterium]
MNPELYRRQINNVRRSLDDIPHFCRTSLSVRDKRGFEVPLEPGPAQLRLFERIMAARAAHRPGRFIYLKARQVWVSTAFEAYIFNRLAFNRGQRAKVVAHLDEAAENIYGYFKQFYDGYRPVGGLLGLPATTQNTLDGITFANESSIGISTANTVTTGRSFSLRYLHLSEYAFWLRAKILMDGLMQSVPDDPDTCVLIESTANGASGDFYERWQEAVDPAQASVWEPIFFAWWEHPEYRRAIAGDVRYFEDSLDQEERTLMTQHAVTLPQLAWRRWKIKEGCGGSVKSFHQEFPSTPLEAFLSSGRPRFDVISLGRMPSAEAPFRGDLEEIRTAVGAKIVRKPHEQGFLHIWKNPQPSRRYVLGVDLCEGIDASAIAGKAIPGRENPDFSVAQLFDIDSGEQVAMLRGRIEPGPFAEMVNLLGRWYYYPYLVPEANGPGLAFLTVILRLDYPLGRIYHREPEVDEQFTAEADTALDKLGFRTSTRTRPQLVSALDNAIRDQSIFIHDPVTLAECHAFIVKPSGKAEAADGCHDDTVIATALVVVGIQNAPPDRRLSKVPRELAGHSKPARQVTRYGGTSRSTSRGVLYRQ